MSKIIGIAGSLRRGSLNAALLRAAVDLMPPGSQIEPASIREIPLYDGDLESATGLPHPVVALQERIEQADGLLLATPEYNGSVPGVLKNAIDWLSRPGEARRRVFRGKPAALIGTTPGRLGTALAQRAWLPVLRGVGAKPWFGGTAYLPGAGRLFDEQGNLVDEDSRNHLREYLRGFVEFVCG